MRNAGLASRDIEECMHSMASIVGTYFICGVRVTVSGEVRQKGPIVLHNAVHSEEHSEEHTVA